MNKKFIKIVALATMLSLTTPVFATPLESTYSSKDWSYTKMTLDEAKELGIPILEFDTQEDASALVKEINNAPIEFKVIENNERSVDGVYEKQCNIAMITISLKTRIATSGNKITSANVYSSVTGFAAFRDWEENDIGTKIVSSGRDFHSWIDGTLTYGIYVGDLGIVEVYSKDVAFEDYRTIFR